MAPDARHSSRHIQTGYTRGNGRGDARGRHRSRHGQSVGYKIRLLHTPSSRPTTATRITRVCLESKSFRGQHATMMTGLAPSSPRFDPSTIDDVSDRPYPSAQYTKPPLCQREMRLQGCGCDVSTHITVPKLAAHIAIFILRSCPQQTLRQRLVAHSTIFMIVCRWCAFGPRDVLQL